MFGFFEKPVIGVSQFVFSLKFCQLEYFTGAVQWWVEHMCLWWKPLCRENHWSSCEALSCEHCYTSATFKVLSLQSEVLSRFIEYRLTSWAVVKMKCFPIVICGAFLLSDRTLHREIYIKRRLANKIIMVTGKALRILWKGCILIVNQVARISGIENGGNGCRVRLESWWDLIFQPKKQVAWTEYFPEIHVLKPSPPCDCTRGKALKEMIKVKLG